MTEQIGKFVGPQGSKRRALMVIIAALATVAALIPFMPGVLAVHDDDAFELDKNASNDTNVTKLGELAAQIKVGDTTIRVCETTAPPAAPFTILVEEERFTVTANDAGNYGGNCAGLKRIYTVSTASVAGHPGSGVESAVSLIEEGVAKPGPDWDQVHATVGSDPDCSTLGLVECAFIEDGIGPSTFIGGGSKDHLPISGWQGTTGASPDKAEILNAYAAKAIEDGQQLLYFGMDRYAVDGSTDIGFWFFKNEVTFDPTTGVFTGSHAVDDILALGTFTQGGATSNIRVFRWVGTGGNESGTIQGPDATFGDCVPGSANDDGCATVNNTSIEVPWNYQFKGNDAGMWIPAGGFFEGGIDLTALNLEGCFSSFLAETRSSPEITAILKDFAIGTFEACDSGMTTTPSDENGGAIGEGGISIGTGSVMVTDSAALDITGVSEWDGTLTFYLCGPDEGLCDDTGTLISSHVIDEESDDPFVSDAAAVTSAGEYCWAAFFDSDTPGVPDAGDATDGECFTVNPVQPAISTDATSTVVLGNAIDDTATLSGTANQPGDPVINPTTAGDPADGTITFNLYGPSDTAVCTNLIATSVVDVSGDGPYLASDGTVTFGDLTPDEVGTYWWIASYSGDSPNTLDVSGECGDEGETTTVTGTASLATAQDWLPNDTATITGDTDLSGTATFTLYTGSDCGADDDDTIVYGPVDVPVSGASPQTAATSNTTVIVEAGSGDYSWLVTYVDVNLDSPDPSCETTTITIDDTP